jgi:hypothetical protein
MPPDPAPPARRAPSGGLVAVALLVAPAAAGAAVVDEVGPVLQTGTNGTWARVIAVDGGWLLGVAHAGDFKIAPLVNTGSGLSDWSWDQRVWVNVTNHGDLKDHAIRLCPDGTFLTVASANVVSPNDSAYAWRLDADLQPRASATLAEGRGDRAHNDMALLCSDLGDGVMFANVGGSGPRGGVWVEVGAGAEAAAELPMGDIAPLGAGVMADLERGLIVLATESGGQLRMALYEPGMVLVDEAVVSVSAPGERSYWPSGLVRAGDFYIVAMMARPDNGPTGDTGNVWLHVLDLDFNLVEQHQLTNFDAEANQAAMRPWLAVQGEQLLVSFDENLNHSYMEVRLTVSGADEAGGGAGGADGGGAPAGDDVDDADDGGKDGGCSATGGAGAGALLPALAALGLRGRRRGRAALRS